MSKSFDGNGSEESIKAALAEKLKLPMKKFMDSSGHVEEVPNLRQPEVDALAETDPDAAIVKADEIRREEALKDVKSTLKIPEREAAARAAGEAAKKAREAEQVAQTAARLEKRKAVDGKLNGLKDAQTVDAFLTAAEVLAAQLKDLTLDDLQMCAGVGEAWKSRPTQMTREQAVRFELLEKFDDEILDRQPQNAEFFRIRKEVDPGSAEARLLAGIKGEERAIGTAMVEEPVTPKPKKVPTFTDNLRSMFGLGKKKE